MVYEIVCIDGEALDRALDILKEYEQRYESIHVIHKENGHIHQRKIYGVIYNGL